MAYQISKAFAFQFHTFFQSFSTHKHVNTWVGHFGLQVRNVNILGKGPRNKTKYQMSEAKAF